MSYIIRDSLMDSSGRANSRIAYMGQRVMQNSLKIYYDEVMSSVLRQEQSSQQMPLKYDLRRHRFRSQGSQILQEYQNKRKPSQIFPSLQKRTSEQKQFHYLSTTKEQKRQSKRNDYSRISQKIQIKRVNIQKDQEKPKKTNGFAAIYENYDNFIKNNYAHKEDKRDVSLNLKPDPQVQMQLTKRKLYSQRPYSKALQILKKTSLSQNNYSQIKPKFKEKSIKTQQPQPEIEMELFLKRSKRGTRQSFKKSLKQSDISFIKPTVTKKQQTHKKLKRCLFAVYFLCCQTKLIRNKINQRRSKHTILFNNISKSIYEYLTNASIKLFSPVISKIKQFKHQKAIKSNSKSYLLHQAQIQKSFVNILPAFKALLLKDKYTLGILKILIKQREHFPDGYLTLFQLQRIQFSKMFLYPVKTFATSVLLLVTFIFVRIFVLGILSQPIRLDPDFHFNDLYRTMVEDLRTYLYQQSIELIQQQVGQGQFFDKKGNWTQIKPKFQYKPGILVAQTKQSNPNSRQLVSHNWNISRVQDFKNKLPNNWQLIKDSLQQWIFQLYDDLKKQANNKQTTIMSQMSLNKTKTYNTYF